MTTLRQMFPQWTAGTLSGIVSRIRTKNTDLTWLTEDLASLLDDEYIASYSGDWQIRPTVARLGAGLTEEQLLDKMAEIWAEHEKIGYVRHHKLPTYEYEPLDNYNGIEEYTESVALHGSGTSSSNSATKRNGYNTSTAVDTGSSTGSQSATSDNTENRSHRLIKHGNLGITTSQQMLTQERDFWRGYDEANYLFNSLDNILILEVC